MGLRGYTRWVGSTALTLAFWTSPAGAVVTVDGFVRTGGGVGIQNADLDWFNRDTQQEVDPTGDHTDATGYFQVVLPDGRYDITVIGPPSNDFAPAFLENQDLRTSQTLPVTVLPAGALLSASVRNEGGAPLSGVTFTFTDVATQDDAFLVNPKSNMVGVFSTVVPLGTFDLVLRAASGTLAPAWSPDLTVSGPANLGSFTMRVGHTVTGSIVDGASQGIFNVDVDVVEESTGDQLFTESDNTDLFGNFSIFIPAGTHEFRFTPSPGSPFAAERIQNVTVAGPMNVGQTTLLPAVTVSGVVRGDGGALLSGSDVDVVDAVTGVERYTPNDNTNASGVYTLRIPVGTYDFLHHPPSGVDLASQPVRDIVISGTTVRPDVQLVPGVLVTGTVTATGTGTPIPGVDLDFVDALGDEYPTPNDDTDAAGAYRARVAPGTYDVTATPSPTSGFSPASILGQPLGTDTVLDFQLDILVAVDPASAPLITAARLRGAPNPFTRDLRVSLSLPEGLEVHDDLVADVFDVMGRRVRTLTAVPGTIDRLAFDWDGRTNGGAPASPGRYFVRVVIGGRALVADVTRLP